MHDLLEFDTTQDFHHPGLTVSAPPGNRIRVHRNIGRPNIHIVMGGTGNLVTLDADCSVHGMLHLEGSGNQVTLGGGGGPQHLQATLYNGDTLIWGRGCTAYGVRIWVHGGRTCEIGDGCLFSEAIQIRTTDHHSIIDLATMECVNAPADIRIEDRVWLGEGVSVAKGVTIGTGSIVGSRSFVNRDIPARELWAGAPARSLRQGVSWVHEHPCTPEQSRMALG